MTDRRSSVLQLFEARPNETPSSVRSRARELSARYLQKDEGLPLAPGDEAGAYEVLEVLGSGGQAVVYKARHRKIGRLVALKVPRREVGHRLLREAELAAHLEHPSIARVEDIHLDGPVPFLVMELCEGGSLDDLLDAHPNGLPLERTRAIATAVLEALAFAHERGVIHRDIKPANILFDRNGTLKVSDFGIGTLAETDTLSVSMDASQRTLGGGTPLYVAPEQEDPSLREDGRLDGRADLFSFGKTLFQLLTAASPRTMRPVSRLRAELSPAWDDYVWKLVEEKPARGFASAKEALAALPRGDERRATPLGPPPVSPPPPAPRRRERLLGDRVAKTADTIAGSAWGILAILTFFANVFSFAQFLVIGLGVQLAAQLVKDWSRKEKEEVPAPAPKRRTLTPEERRARNARVLFTALAMVFAATAVGGLSGALTALGEADGVYGWVVALGGFVALATHLAGFRPYSTFGLGLVVSGALTAATILDAHIFHRHFQALPIGVALLGCGAFSIVLGLFARSAPAAPGLTLTTVGPYGERLVGSWQPSLFTPDRPALVALEVTLDGPGEHVVEWTYERGAHAIAIDACTLVEDGRVIASDDHQGWAGGAPRDTAFKLRVEAVKPGARYEIRSRLRPQGGTDSHGSVWIRRA